MIFVILIGGRPYLDRSYSAIRTYTTRERAEKRARELVRWYPEDKIEVGVFGATDITEVDE